MQQFRFVLGVVGYGKPMRCSASGDLGLHLGEVVSTARAMVKSTMRVEQCARRN